MKNFLIFIGGFFCGAVFIAVLGLFSYTGITGLTVFDEEGKCFHTNSIKVFQALGKGGALANIGGLPNGTLVLLIDENDKSFYDGEIIPVPKDKCAKQIGTYQYKTKADLMKTVPAVVIK